MKQLLTMLITISSMTGTSVPASEPQVVNALVSYPVATTETSESEYPLIDIETLVEQAKQAALEEQQVQRLRENAVAIDRAVAKLKKYAGKTWYVFSGSSPSGWDCSGLVRWTYQQLGRDLVHSASAQMYSGKRVKAPLPGDIVGWSLNGGRDFYHVGIYLGNGKVIHAPNTGSRTRISNVDDSWFWGTKRYVRVIPRDASTPQSREDTITEVLTADQ